MIQRYLPHIVFFSVFVAALVPVLYYYRRRNPNPRFRPGTGEMLLITVFALVFGGAASYGLGEFFKREPYNQYSGRPEEGVGWSKDSATRQDEDKDDSRYQQK